MTRYLLDTDISSYLIKGRHSALQDRFAMLASQEWAISALTAAEILEGIEHFPAQHPLRLKAAKFLFSATVLPWPAEATFAYAKLKLQTKSQPIGDFDLLIAAHAVALSATLVTNNEKHFGRLGDSIRIENWVA